MDHISRIYQFLEVVKQGSFAAAARQLGVSGPALSKQVAALEAQLGVKLLHRTTRQVRLTEAGALYSERARRALDDIQEAEKRILELKDCPTGLLRISLPMSFGRQYLAKPLAEFAQRYPDVIVDVELDDRMVDVIAEGFDVAVRIASLKDSGMVARKLANCPVVLCASPAHLQRHGTPETLVELSQQPAIIYSKQSNINEWRLTQANGNKASVALQKRFCANNAEMMLEACLQGIGVAMLPIFTAAPYLQSGRLVQLLPEYSFAQVPGIYALFPQNRYLSTKVRLFIDTLIEESKHWPW